MYPRPGNTKGGSITVPFDLLFDKFGFVRFANKNKNCLLSYCRFQTSQTSQTVGQQYSDTSPFSIPCLDYIHQIKLSPVQNKYECSN